MTAPTYHEIIRERAWRAGNTVPVNVTPEDTGRITDAASDVWAIHVDRLMDALRAAGVSDELVEALTYDGVSSQEGVRREMLTDLTAKVQLLVDHLASHGLLEDGCFTFPDGVTWGVSE